MFVVSACLAGFPCRYDGKSQSVPYIETLCANHLALPLCPETLGGLTVPRIPCEWVNDRVMTQNGQDYTHAFMMGACRAMVLARLAGVRRAILKARSPSCGVGARYDGTFSGTCIHADGLFTMLLRQNNIRVYTEDTFFEY